MTRRLHVALAVLLALGAAAVADEPADAPIEWTGTVRYLGKPVGTLRLESEALPADASDPARWLVRETLQPTAAGMDEQRGEAYLDADFHAIRGSYRRSNPRGFLEARWHLRPDGRVLLEHETAEFENRIEPEGRGPMLATAVGLVHWLKKHGDAAHGRSIADFEPDPGPGDPYVATLHVESHGAVRWRRGEEVEQLATFSVTRGQRTLRFAFDATGRLRTFEIVGLGLDVADGDGPAYVLDDPDGLTRSMRDRAAEAARTARRRLDAPSRPYRFDGDLVLDGAAIGRVRIEATPASEGGEPAWDVLETTERRGGDAIVRSESSYRLAQDLTVLRGEQRVATPTGGWQMRFERVGDRMRLHWGSGESRTTTEGLVGPDATMGTLAVLLLARDAAPRDAAIHWVLPSFDPRFVRAPNAGSGSVPTGDTDLTVDVGAPADGARDVRVRSRLGFETVYHVSTTDGVVRGATGVVPRSGWAPAGEGGPAPDWFDAIEGTPRNAWQAFIKFGRGYHLPRRDLLEVAVDWAALHAHEIAEGHWPPNTSLDTVREAWIEEFVSQSKHRSTGDCDDLLMQIFLTMSVTREGDGSITFAATPLYGGHRYRIADGGRDGWRIVKID